MEPDDISTFPEFRKDGAVAVPRWLRSEHIDEAKEASYKKGAITILLLDGPAIADLLVEGGLGVRKLPLFLFDIDEEFFDLEEE